MNAVALLSAVRKVAGFEVERCSDPQCREESLDDEKIQRGAAASLDPPNGGLRGPCSNG
jgi:hypothetical protein